MAQVGTTVRLSAFSALGALILGGSVACLAAFSSVRVARVLGFIMTLPLLVGFVARNYSWIGFLAQFQSGSLAWIGGLQDSSLGVVVVMSTVFAPLAYYIVAQGALRLRPELFYAARTLGSSDGRAFLVITLPLLGTSVAIGAAASLVLGLGYFVTPQLIGGGNFPFIGNGVLRLLNELGDVAAASRLALLLLFTVLAPPLAVIALSRVWRRLARRRGGRLRESKGLEPA